MPILWRFLLTQYIKVLVLCAITFISVLLTTRLDEIAHFAALGAEGKNILLYVLYQIPYIIPIAIPISCLISSIILVQRLSATCELTALRSSGMAIRQFLNPILYAAGFISLLNFYFVSEVATDSHLSSGMLKTQLKSINPLLMLHSKHLMKVKGFYFDSLGASKLGETASEVILAMPNHSSGKIHLMVATQLNASVDNFVGKGISLITSMEGEKEGSFDHLMIENIGKTVTSIEDFAGILQKKSWSINNDHLKMSLLLARIHEEKRNLQNAIASEKPKSEQKQIRRSLDRCYTEIARRISIAFAAFSFTLMGASFGMSISRNRSNRGIITVIVLTAIYLSTFFVAKGIDNNLVASTLIYIVPHFIIIGISLWVLSRISRGIET
jgi:lipopolysaccharide export system permease protein